MKTPRVQDVCQALWGHRERCGLQAPDAREWSRRLVLAAAEDVREHAGYSPAHDARYQWALAVLDGARAGLRIPRAAGDQEAMAAWLLERMPPVSGRALAAGC